MEKDVGWKRFLSDDSRYADIINGIGCNGEQVVSEDDLHEMDGQVGQKHRDCIRKVAFGVNFAIMGIENQEEIDYAIPVRGMTYDAGVYDSQVSKRRRENRKNSKGLTPGEYLYGFRKEDKVNPVITFVLYAGQESWDGPTTLHDIVNFEDIPDELQDMVSDYKVNLVNIRELTDTSVFHTDVRQVFDLIRCADDKEAFRQLIESDTSYEDMEEAAFDVAMQYTKANELLHMKEQFKGTKGGINVCKALTELLEDSRIAGEARGEASGVHLARQIFKLYIAGKNPDEIALACSVPVAKVEEILA